MSAWTKFRNTAESAAVVAGNYFAPGSSLITSNIASKGSQQQLSSDLGKIAQVAGAGVGLGIGSGLTGIAPSTVGQSITSTVSGWLTPAAPSPSAVLPGTIVNTADGSGTFVGVGGPTFGAPGFGTTLSNIATGTVAAVKAIFTPSAAPQQGATAMPAPSSNNYLSTGFGGLLGGYDPGIATTSPLMGGPTSGNPSAPASPMLGIGIVAALVIGVVIWKKKAG